MSAPTLWCKSSQDKRSPSQIAIAGKGGVDRCSGWWSKREGGHRGAESWIWGEGHWCPERFASHPIHHPPPAPLGLHTPFFSRPNQPQQRPNFCWNCDSAIIRRWRPQSQTTLGTGGGKVCTADRFIDIVWQQLAEEWLIGHQKTDRRPLSRLGGVWG